MKIGQKILVAEFREISERDPKSNEYIEFYGEEIKRNIVFRFSWLKIIKAINFTESPFKLNQRNGCKELCFNGIVLVKIQYSYGKIDYGVGVFWTIGEWSLWNQFGCICLLSDIEGKRYLRNLHRLKIHK